MGLIRMPQTVLTELTAHLDRRGGHFAFLIAAVTWSQGEPVFMVKRAHRVPDDQTSWVRDGHEVSTDAMIAAINLAVRERAALIEVHNHRGPRPRWSPTDREGLEETVPYMLSSMPGRPYGAAVWGAGELSGEWFAEGGLRGEFRSAVVVGSSLRQLISRQDDVDGEPGLARQEPWFTAIGQRQLGRLRVGIVGNSGTGSPLIQNLIYLGLRDFVLVEPDPSDPTSMNRLVTATAADMGTPKAILGRRLIKSVAPTAAVQVFETDLRAPAALDALRGVDLLFGCVDNDGARLVLNEFAVAYGIPYVDLAVGIDAKDGQVREAGGRVALVLPGGPCLWCMGEIDPEEASYFLAPETERAERRRRGYVKGMDVPAPSVVSLNAAIGAAAVNELAVWVSGAREVSRFVEVDLLGKARRVASQWMTPRQFERDPGCVQCSVAGLGDAADLERYELSA